MNHCVEIVMRSKNDGPLIGAVLASAHRQKQPVQLVHIDSGSTDDTVAMIRKFQPAKLIPIRAEDYVPGKVLNRGMRETSGEWVVFLNSDAEPCDGDWLSSLLATAKASPHTAAAFSCQLPRPDCEAVYAHDYVRCFGPNRESIHWEHFFSMVSCVVNRAAWLEQPFREDLQYAEDDEWSRRVKNAGWRVAFAEDSRVMHSHNYTLREAYRRARGDALAQARAGHGLAGFRATYLGALVSAGREACHDFLACCTHRRLSEWPHAVLVRLYQRCGKCAGNRAGQRQQVREKQPLSVAAA